jgi:hypothetical protein
MKRAFKNVIYASSLQTRHMTSVAMCTQLIHDKAMSVMFRVGRSTLGASSSYANNREIVLRGAPRASALLRQPGRNDGLVVFAFDARLSHIQI